jgi:hypothetical protein
VVDRFTKYNHFLPLKHPFTTQSLAKMFLNQVYKLHGLSLSIVANRGQIFISNFWSALFKLVSVQLSMGSAYNPQSDGQTERVNQCMETYLRVSSLRVQGNGLTGYHWPSSGIIPVIIHRSTALRSKPFMVTLLTILGFVLML